MKLGKVENQKTLLLQIQKFKSKITKIFQKDNHYN